jgi:hypothetical protein
VGTHAWNQRVGNTLFANRKFYETWLKLH